MIERRSKIYVAGHGGMVGSALLRLLAKRGYENVITRGRQRLDLTRQADVEAFFAEAKPKCVFLLAARVGGIADSRERPADALLVNSLIELNVIKAAFESGVEKLVFTASSAAYPAEAPQPMPEAALLTGRFDFSLEGYALAKTLGIKYCEYLGRQHGAPFSAAVPPNLYGPGDKGSTVVPMLIAKFYDAVTSGAQSVRVWGTGNARREFMHADDLADALLFIADNHGGGEHINVGFGSDVTVREVAETVKKASGFKGNIIFDKTKPDGAARKLLDGSKLASLGWKAKIPLESGIASAFADYAERQMAL